MKAKVVLGIAFALALTGVVANKNVTADDVSLWIGTGQLTKTLLQSNVMSDNSDKFCQRGAQYELLYTPNINNIPSWIYKQPSPVQGCWQNTAPGGFGSSTQYFYIGSGLVTRIRNPGSHVYYAVGNSSKVVGIYNVGYQRYLYMFDDINSAGHIEEGVYYNEFVFNSGAPRWTLSDPATNMPLRMQRVQASQNGKWLIIEATNGFIRVNTETKEILTFESTLYAYGYGQDPTYDLAISNDGRYAVIAGGSVVDRSNFLYDLSTCQPVAQQPLTKATGCGKRNIKSDIFPELPVNQAAQRFIFSDDSENMTVDVPENNQWNRYVVTAAGKNYHGLDYLALGDSYSSGEGEYDGKGYLAGTDGDGAIVPAFQTGIADFPYAVEKCHISQRSYPYLLASSANLTQNGFRSVACSGSKSDDIINTNFSGDYRYDGHYGQFAGLDDDDDDVVRAIKDIALSNFTPSRAAQIEFVSRYKPRVATIGIGGNDIGFGDIIKSCLSVGTCSYVTDQRLSSGKIIQAKYYDLLSLYQKLHNASPTTRFYAVGYPQIFGENNSSCPANVWLDDKERTHARHVVDYLNKIIKSAADAGGVTYISVADSLAGFELCNANGNDSAMNATSLNAWNKDTASDDQTIEFLGAKLMFFGNETYHPNPLGNRMIADAITKDMNYEDILSYNPCPTLNSIMCTFQPISVAPPLDTYFTEYQAVTVDYAKQVHLIDNMALQINGQSALQPGSTIQINNFSDENDVQSNLLPNSQSTIGVYSTYRALGTLDVDVSGKLNGQFTLPTDLETGHHTLVIRATNRNYQKIELLQPITIYNSVDDIDGDGISNADDACQFVAPSGVDIDRDGVDDACDGVIAKAADTTKPVVTAVVDGVSDTNAWLNHDVTITWQVTDDSDETITPPVAVVASQEGEHTYQSEEVCDSAGNCARGEITLKIDKTSPSVSELVWTINPKTTTETSQLTIPIDDTLSGVAVAEYFIGDNDPGRGNGAQMIIAGGVAQVMHATDFVTGVYTISVRTRDHAGNWSNVSSGYLVVYDPTSGVKVRGRRTVMIEPGYSISLPWIREPTIATFGISVKYDKEGTIARQSDVQFNYKTGTHCQIPALAHNCHTFDFNATSIIWLATGGTNQSLATFKANGTLRRDGISQPTSIVFEARDGTRVDAVSDDMVSFKIYTTTLPFSSPELFLPPTPVSRGNVKIGL